MNLILSVISFKHKITESHVTTFSGYATLFMIMSLFPFVMFFLTLLQFTTLTADNVLQLLEPIAPYQFFKIFEGLIRELFSQATGAVLSFSLITALWSASKGVYGLVRGLNSVYQVEESRNYFVSRLLAMLYTMAFVLILVISLVLLVFGNRIQLLIETHWPLISRITGTILSLRTLIMAAILMLLFLIMYWALPNRKARLSRQLPGAILAAVGWMLLSFGFSLYIDWVPGVSVTYGSLTTLTLLMLWLNMCNTLLLVGGAFNKWLEDRKEV